MLFGEIAKTVPTLKNNMPHVCNFPSQEKRRTRGGNYSAINLRASNDTHTFPLMDKIHVYDLFNIQSDFKEKSHPVFINF